MEGDVSYYSGVCDLAVSMLDMGFIALKWLTCCGYVLFVGVSGLGHLFNSLGFLVTSILVVVSWQLHLWMLKVRRYCLSFLQWGALILLNCVLSFVGWTLLQWLQHLWLMFRQLVEVLYTIFLDWGILFEWSWCCFSVPMVLQGVYTGIGMVLKRGYPSTLWSWKGSSFTCWNQM